MPADAPAPPTVGPRRCSHPLASQGAESRPPTSAARLKRAILFPTVLRIPTPWSESSRNGEEGLRARVSRPRSLRPGSRRHPLGNTPSPPSRRAEQGVPGFTQRAAGCDFPGRCRARRLLSAGDGHP